MSKKNTIEIAPSILSANWLCFEQEIKLLEKAGADLIHIDIMDNHFVPNLTFGPDLIKHLRKITNLPLDVHLMVNPVDDIMERCAEYGADTIIIHPESNPNIFSSIQKIKKRSVYAGLAINPGTCIESVIPMIGFIDKILVMTVNPGFGGQKLITQSLEKVKHLRKIIDDHGYEIDLQVDGGINPLNAKSVVSSGANILVAGNSIFKNTDYKQAIDSLRLCAMQS